MSAVWFSNFLILSTSAVTGEGESKLIKILMRKTWRLPKGVASGQAFFLQKRRYRQLRWILKYIKRRIFVFIAVQHFGLTREVQAISDSDRNILWINWAAPSLGDSLMDLSARVMLYDRKVTLLTHPHNVELYRGDPYFHAVYSDPMLLRSENGSSAFDIVLCDAFSPRVLFRKILVAPLVPFVGLYGYINGFEVHRTRFAFERMSQLLGVSNSRYFQRPSIMVSDEELVQRFPSDVCIAVGGEWSFRTYNHWLEVIERLILDGHSVSLVGSKNGIETANAILASQPAVRSTVGMLSLKEVVSHIAKAKMFIGADGGLWHIACAIPTPSVVLFADCQIFDEEGKRVTRETEDIICETLYHENDVSCIPSVRVNEAFKRLVKKL